jgi:hypothetical protein
MRLRILVVAALAALAFPAVADAGQIRNATKLLKGKRFATHIGSVDSATIDRTLDLCRDGRYVYRSTFLYPNADELQEQTLSGRWKVVKARLRGGFGTVIVRWTGDDGSRGRIRLVANNRGVYVEGQVAEVLRAGC